MRIRLLVVFTVTLGLIASAGLAKDTANSQTRAQELSDLQKAYSLLKIADKDYHGHRAKAMRSIESAAREVGGAAKTRHPGREAQATSDEQLRLAANILESVSTMASQIDQSRLSNRVSKALKEIHTALAMK